MSPPWPRRSSTAAALLEGRWLIQPIGCAIMFESRWTLFIYLLKKKKRKKIELRPGLCRCTEDVLFKNTGWMTGTALKKHKRANRSRLESKVLIANFNSCYVGSCGNHFPPRRHETQSYQEKLVMHDISIPGQRLNLILTFLISAVTSVNIPILLPVGNKYAFNTSTMWVQNLYSRHLILHFNRKSLVFPLWLYWKKEQPTNSGQYRCCLPIPQLVPPYENIGSC